MEKSYWAKADEKRRARMAADPAFAARRREQKRMAAIRDRERNAEKRQVERTAAGMTYLTGEPCSRGHVAARYSINQTCVDCSAEDAALYEKKRAVRMQTDLEFRVRRREQKNVTASRWRKSHRGEKSAEWAQWHANKLRRTPPWADLQAIRKIYEEAARLTKETGEPWHVDHEIPLNGRLVSGLHLAENLRVIQGIENLRKGAQFMQP
jgi:hypothetical protein